VAPSAIKLGIDTLDFTVAQVGAWTKVTDLASIQSPHDLRNVAADKIGRLAAQSFDKIARTALAAGASDLGSAGGQLDSAIVGDAIAIMQERDVQPVPGAGYYFLLHPNALRGLTGENGLTGWRDVIAQADAGQLTRGAVGQYQGGTFLTSTRFAADGSGNYPVYVLGAASMGAGDMSTFSYHRASGAAPGNELAQFESFGFKGIAGAKVISFAGEADGAGTNDPDTVRAIKFTVSSGRLSGLGA
jgi:N4-gp56 family major capsid protein